MARRRKPGIEYSPWDVNVFSDPKIIRLLDSHGADGFLTFFAVCQNIYATNGYFARWGDGDAEQIVKMLYGKVTSDAVDGVVVRCLDLELFDAGVYRRRGVLTSRAIQRNFAEVLFRRDRKEVDAGIWILDPEESRGAIPV